MRNSTFFRPLSILILFTIYSGFLYAEQYAYKQISQKEGLPSNVRCIYKERNNIWFGTPKGIYRFDGNELKHYELYNNPNAPDNTVYQIICDKEKNLWALTGSALVLYNQDKDAFIDIKNEAGKSIATYSICMTEDGFFIGGENKIYRFRYESRKIETFKTLKTSRRFVIDQLQQIDGERLICSNNKEGFFILDTASKETSRSLFDCPKEISCIFIDTGKRIWIAGYNQGILCFDNTGKEIARYNTQNSRLSNDIVLSMTEKDSLIWIGTDGGGINILNPENGNIQVLSHIPGNNHSLPTNSIQCLYNDSDNNIWAGSIRNGAINIRQGSIRTYTDTNNRYGLSNPTILCLYQTPREKSVIWIGTDGGGLNSFDTEKQEFTYYPQTRNMKIASIASYSDSELLLSLYSKGLFLFNKKNGRISPYAIKEKGVNNEILYTGKIVNLFNETNKDLLLLGTNLYRYKPYSKSTEQIMIPEPHNTSFFSPIVATRDYVLVHNQHSIYKINKGDTLMEAYFRIPQQMKINSASMDSTGNIWIATNAGLARLSLKDKQFTHLPTTLFKEVTAAICDNKGKVWLGTDNHRLFAYLIDENSFTMFGESDGVIPNDFLEIPHLITAQQDIYIGGTQGLLCIDKDFDIKISEEPEIKLANVKIDGRAVYIDKENPMIKVPYRSKTLEIQITSLENDIFREKIYRYFFKAGKEEQQIESYSPTLVLPLLPTGQYALYASCNMRDGKWSSPVQIAAIDVLTPWWKTWWFALSCSLFATCIILIIATTLIHRHKNKLKILMKERERDIYEEKVRFLINISHELRTPLTLIYAPLKRILQKMQATDSNFLDLSRIYRQTSRMKELINMVLDLRKMEVGEDNLKIESHNVNEWIHEIADDFTSEAEVQGIEIQIETSPEIGNINFDKRKCNIILTNLLTNAVKHSSRGNTIRITSELTERKTVRISVIDQGTGLTGVDPQKLFTRFYQGSEENYGTGIGLAYSKILVELHGGSIGAVNNEKQGATFFFELPSDIQAGQTICESKAYLNELTTPDYIPFSPTHTEIFDTGQTDILLVDDSTELLEFMEKALQDKFRNVYTASDGKEALELLEKKIPNIIISDVMMPHMNGYELCRQLKSDINYSHIPVILLTAKSEEQSQKIGYQLGADGFLAKPFDIDTLLEIVRSKLKAREDIKQRFTHPLLPQETQVQTFNSTDENFLLKLNNIIIENIGNAKLGLPFICQEIGMSRTSLYNKLKAITGIGLNDYINKIRIEKAILLIQSGGLSVAEIAEQVGFTTSRYFSTVFKQHTGQTPTQYKDQNERKRQ